MSELDALRTFYRYNARVRLNYLKTLIGLSTEERLKDRGASYPSLQEIFVHSLDGIRWWLQTVPKDRTVESQPLDARSMSPAEISAEVEEVDRLVWEYLDPLVESDLTSDMVCHFDNNGKRVEVKFPVGDVLWHVVEEELQHRGEINALLWQMDVDPPIAGVDDWNASKVPPPSR